MLFNDKNPPIAFHLPQNKCQSPTMIYDTLLNVAGLVTSDHTFPHSRLHSLHSSHSFLTLSWICQTLHYLRACHLLSSLAGMHFPPHIFIPPSPPLGVFPNTTFSALPLLKFHTPNRRSIFIFFVPQPPPDMKRRCLFCSLLFYQHYVQCLEDNRYTINIWKISKC